MSMRTKNVVARGNGYATPINAKGCQLLRYSLVDTHAPDACAVSLGESELNRHGNLAAWPLRFACANIGRANMMNSRKPRDT